MKVPPVKPLKISSQWWRLCHIYTIRDKHGRLVPFRPNHEQAAYYLARHTFNHIGKARQLGFSTFEKIIDLDNLLFPSGDSVLPPSPDGISVGHIDFTLPDAKKKLRIVREAYEHMSNPDLHPETAALGKGIKAAVRLRFSAESVVGSNGSTMWIGTSLRGSTPQRLDISELGKIAYFHPGKAEEIRAGALNTIAPGNVANIESTHEGGEAGLHYELMSVAMEADPKSITPVDFKFHFFPWYGCPDYNIHAPHVPIRPEISDYFARVSAATGRRFSHAQMLWYDRTEKKQRYAMKKEFPTTPGEMFEAINQFAIYGTEMADLMAAGRFLDFGLYREQPVFTFWDIGMSDTTAVWLIQPTERFHLVLDHYEHNGVSAGYHADVMRQWEQKWRKTIASHVLPHDADNKSPGSGRSFRDELRLAGLANTRVVPRTPDIWIGIGHVRDVLPHCWFHQSNCDRPREVDGVKLASGVACLKGYHKEITPANKRLREMPAHDQFSHSADAFRTFAEAWRLRMIDDGGGGSAAKPRAVGGVKPQARARK